MKLNPRVDPKTVVAAAAKVAEVLTYAPATKEELARLAGYSGITIQRALQYLRDRGAWLEFSQATKQWNLHRGGVDWEQVTLGEAYRAGILPEHERWILEASAQTLPAEGVRRKAAAANPARLKRDLLS